MSASSWSKLWERSISKLKPRSCLIGRGGMIDITLGEASIRSVVEVSGLRYRPEFIFPAVSREQLSLHSGWMAPDLYDPARNLIAMVRQTNVVRTRYHTILIDTCVGDCKRRNVPNFHMQLLAWQENFRTMGLAFEDIEMVMCTHLHVDHVGWNTRLQSGRWVPTFPKARYLFGRTEFEYWQAEHRSGRDSPDGSVFEDSVLPIVEAGQALIVDDDCELSDGFWLEPAFGHSVGHLAIHLENVGGHLVFSGDIMHHPIQVREPDLASRFCENPDRATSVRRRFLEVYADRDVLIAPAHFERGTIGRIESAADGFHFNFLAGGSTCAP